MSSTYVHPLQSPSATSPAANAAAAFRDSARCHCPCLPPLIIPSQSTTSIIRSKAASDSNVDVGITVA
ncbi:hypothetical protein ACLOJK_036363 [Asimina triloba]